jgi:hypothetical protein
MAGKATALRPDDREGPATPFARLKAPQQFDHLDVAGVATDDDAALTDRGVRVESACAHSPMNITRTII